MIDMGQADSSLRKDDRVSGVYMVRDYDGVIVARNLNWFGAYRIVLNDLNHGFGTLQIVRVDNKGV